MLVGDVNQPQGTDQTDARASAQDVWSITIYDVGMIVPWRRLALYAARKIAADPEARAKAGEVVQRARRKAKQIVDDPNPPRAAGQTVRRVAEQLRRRLRSD